MRVIGHQGLHSSLEKLDLERRPKSNRKHRIIQPKMAKLKAISRHNALFRRIIKLQSTWVWRKLRRRKTQMFHRNTFCLWGKYNILVNVVVVLYSENKKNTLFFLRIVLVLKIWRKWATLFVKNPTSLNQNV